MNVPASLLRSACCSPISLHHLQHGLQQTGSSSLVLRTKNDHEQGSSLNFKQSCCVFVEHFSNMGGSWAVLRMFLQLLLFYNSTFVAVAWRPCTDLFPLDLLSHSLPQGGHALSGVHTVQAEGARGVHMTSPLSFPSSQVFVNCLMFPHEFSIMVTLKTTCSATEKREYLLSVVQEEKKQLLLGLRFSEEQLQLVYHSPRGRERLSFQRVWLADGHWHTLVLALSGHHASLTLDCGVTLELFHDRPFPADLSTAGSRIHIGSRKLWSGMFSGLLRQLVLLPGSDATRRVCPAGNPRLAELAVPPVLKDLPGPPDDVQVQDGGSCTEVMVSRMQKGFFFFIHGNTALISMLKVFQIPSVGLFAAMAHRSSKPGSGIYRWRDGRFELHQNITTFEAHSWKHFIIGNKVFLVVSNSRGPVSSGKEASVIYKWSDKKQKFLRYQTLETYSARDWEAFHIQNQAFLAVANHRKGNGEHKINSVIYKWNPGTRAFEVNQTILTSGAYDLEFFTVGPYHFLAVANAFDGTSTSIDSTIYIWLRGAFQHFQTIRTFGATDWEMFRIGDRVFLAVANGHMLYMHGKSLYAINSTIYELDLNAQMFLRFQDIGTYSAVDWEFFTLGDEHFLVVANSYNGLSYSLNSVIYRWQGYEGFVPIHWLPTIGCSDWEFFSTMEGSFLMYSSARQSFTKVFKLKTR
ncbi:thrombospondin-type laminin G domain and EAR repeat-containing protein isoform X2 [Denticeps clupeoides]|uniref:thrombospondin-type laminin G domain and EAR repeat-containing protein isoform X2 n=1 Tax=Denticeps clupeoides TaxID=299321 RepID=UPI0010A4FA3E|nr:thrombospondin-type laminin G domain and EAR repeat-containing protein-like isoform X2 [Denticeps clupeoides]